MKVYDKIEQGSAEWHALRYGKVGGSTLEKVMANEGKPVIGNAIYNELLAARLESFVYEEGFKSEAMERGNRLEPLARLAFEDLFGVEVIQIGWAEKSDFIGISPDGLIGSNQAIEIKCPSANTHVGYMRNPISMVEYYLWQCVMYFVVFEDLEVLNFVSYRPENVVCPLLVQTINKDTEVRVSAKKTATIGQLVTEAYIRLSELEEALKTDINNYLKF
jgi:hypothetical protein